MIVACFIQWKENDSSLCLREYASSKQRCHTIFKTDNQWAMKPAKRGSVRTGGDCFGQERRRVMLLDWTGGMFCYV